MHKEITSTFSGTLPMMTLNKYNRFVAASSIVNIIQQFILYYKDDMLRKLKGVVFWKLVNSLLFSFAHTGHSTVSLYLKLMYAWLHKRMETSSQQKVPKVVPGEWVKLEAKLINSCVCIFMFNW